MNKDDMREEFKAAAKAAGNVAKTTGNLLMTGYNALSDNAENKRKNTLIKYELEQAAAAKAAAMAPLLISLTANQRSLLDPYGYYEGIPGQFFITLEPFQENIATAHNIGKLKAAGGQDYAALLEEIIKEHATDASTIYLRLRYELARLWIYKAAPNVDINTPANAVVINSCLEFRYGLEVAKTTMYNVILPNLKNLWNTDVALIQFLKIWGLHTFNVRFENNIITIQLQ